LKIYISIIYSLLHKNLH